MAEDKPTKHGPHFKDIAWRDDITDLKKAFRKLEKQSRRLENVLDATCLRVALLEEDLSLTKKNLARLALKQNRMPTPEVLKAKKGDLVILHVHQQSLDRLSALLHQWKPLFEGRGLELMVTDGVADVQVMKTTENTQD